jgi:hypothetical protein
MNTQEKLCDKRLWPLFSTLTYCEIMDRVAIIHWIASTTDF